MAKTILKSAILGLNEDGLELLNAIDRAGQVGAFTVNRIQQLQPVFIKP